MIEALSSRIHFAIFGADLSYDDGFPAVTDGAVVREHVSGGKTLAAFRVALPHGGGFDNPTEYTTKFSRYLSDGTLDKTFGKNGYLDVGITSEVQVVAGSRILVIPQYFNEQQVIFSYTLNGRVDATFGGGDGVAVIPVNAQIGGNVLRDGSNIVAVLDDGKVMIQSEIYKVVGSKGSQRQHDVIRMNPDGSLDTSFGHKGYLSFRQDKGNTRVTLTDSALYLHFDYLYSTTPPSGELVKISLDGKTADTSFGGDGRVDIAGFVSNITEQPDGKLVFLSTIYDEDPVLYRLKTDGTPDTAFSGDGKLTLPDPDSDTRGEGESVLLDSQNRILVGVESTLWRVSAGGVIDSSYPYNGTVPFTGGIASTDADGNIYTEDGRKYGFVTPQQIDDKGIIQISTDYGDDIIDISSGSGKVVVVVNGESRRFRLADVLGFNIQTFDGELDLKVTVDRPVTLRAGDGNAFVRTADADDDIKMRWGDHELVLGQGNDKVELGQVIDNRDSDQNIVVGSGGNKDISVYTGVATIDLAAGNHEVVTVSHTHDNTVRIAGGNNNVRLEGPNSRLTIGGNGANDITSYGQNAVVTTGTGSDKVLAISPYGVINTTGGNDEITIRNFTEAPTRGVTVYAGSGNDHVFCDSGYQSLATVYGGPGDDLLEGNTLSQRFYGENGNDTLTGGDGTDYLYGGDLDDVIIGGASSDRLYGEAGNDKLYGQAGNDKLYGGTGDDRLFAQTGSDELFGDEGNDRLYADNNNGRYLMHGGVGNDLFFTRNNSIDTLFGDAGDDAADADANDVLESVTRA